MVGGDLFLIDLPVWLNLNDESSCDREWLGSQVAI